MKRRPFYLVCGSLIALLAAVLLSYPIRHREPGVPRVKVEMLTIANALRQYESTYNEFPLGDDSCISRALLGSNVQSIVFLYARTNDLGELIDPWKTAYKIRIELSDRTNFLIQSAGKNKMFSDSDDYALDSTKSDSVQEPRR